MHSLGKHSIVLLLVAALILLPCVAMAGSYSEVNDKQIAGGSMAADGLVARPLGIVATVGGFCLFVISSPFSALGGNIGEAWDSLVVYPAKFTFARPLGDFD
jgi:hypothetical protein